MVEPRVPPTFGPRLGHGMMAESPGMKRSSESTLAQPKNHSEYEQET
jgi:hypothetical protein